MGEERPLKRVGMEELSLKWKVKCGEFGVMSCNFGWGDVRLIA